MRRISFVVIGTLVLVILIGMVFAAAPKSYQVTGPVLSVTNDVIVVQKGDDRWEVGRDAATKISGDLKVGAKVTIYYRMVATSVEVKSAVAKGTAK
jgi:hypothetical protein